MSAAEETQKVSPADRLQLQLSAVAELRKVLDGLSHKDRREVLAMSLAPYGLTATRISQNSNRSLAPAPRKQKPRKARAKHVPASPEVKEIRKKIKEINAEIKAESAKIGANLKEGHDLLNQRNQLFLELKELKNQAASPKD